MFLEPYVEGSSVCPIYCCNLDMLIDKCHIYEIYLNFNFFLFLVKSFPIMFSVLKEILRLKFFNGFVSNFVLYQCV